MQQAFRHGRMKFVLLPVIVLALGLSGCSEDDPAGPVAGVVILQFDQVVAGVVLVIESSTTSFPYTNAAGNPFNVSELEYLVSDFRLHNTDGTVYGVDAVHFREADDPATRSFTISGVPSGTYNAVSFTYGLDEEKNVTGGLPPTPEFIALEWPPNWGGGYHYMEMNGNYQDGGVSYGYRTHTGRRFIAQPGDPSGFGPDDVEHHHYFEVKLSVAPFTVDGDTWAIPLVMDVNQWYAPEIFDLSVWFPSGAGNIMPNLDAQRILMDNGRQVYSTTGAVKQ